MVKSGERPGKRNGKMSGGTVKRAKEIANAGNKGARILIREEYCMGCRLCEVHCITEHSDSGNIIKAYRGSTPPPASGIYFESKGSVSFALQCRHCDDAPCLEGCLTGALYRDPESGAILHDPEKCIGCWTCIALCPFGAVKPDTGKHTVASKCDLCVERAFPACVENCPNEAIVLVDRDGRRIDKDESEQ